MRYKQLKHALLAAAATCVLGLQGASADTLTDALTRAYQSNPQLASQRADAQLAQESLAQARAGRRPTVNLSASTGLEYVDSTGPFAFNNGDRSVSSASITATQPLFTSGTIDAGIRQATAGISAADARLEALGQTLFLQTVISYVNVRRDEAAIDIRQRNVAVLEEQVRAATDRFDVGVVTRTDVALAEARLEGARAALAGASAQLEGSKAVYELLVGMPVNNLAPVPPMPPLPQTYEEALAAARVSSPDLVAARAAERAAKEAIDGVKGQLGPQISLVGTASVRKTFDPNQRDTNVTALAQGTVPLFEGGLIRSQVRSAKLQSEQARLSTEALERQIVSDIARSWYTYEASLRSIEASNRQVEAATIAYEGAKEELAVGVRTTLDVLDQEQQLFEARLAVINAERDAYVAGHELMRAMGVLTPTLMNIDAAVYNPDDYGALIGRKWLLTDTD